MKILSLIVLMLIGFAGYSAPADPVDSTGNADIIPGVAAALRAGNAADLAAYFSATIDLTVPGSEGTYSKSQAELIVKEFFTGNRPKGFVIKHQGSSGEGSQFCIGSLQTEAVNYRTYFLVKMVDGTSMITQLQFEEE